MKSVHDFRERLAYADGFGSESEIVQHLLRTIPGAVGPEWAAPHEDRAGTDLWIHRRGDRPPISVDFKHREFDPIERFGSDDACIETCSIYRGAGSHPFRDEHREQIGWTLDGSKRTDWIVYTWPKGSGRRFWMLYFPHLCYTAQAYWKQWAREYGERAALNDSYSTLSVYVPRTVIAQAMRVVTLGVL